MSGWGRWNPGNPEWQMPQQGVLPTSTPAALSNTNFATNAGANVQSNDWTSPTGTSTAAATLGGPAANNPALQTADTGMAGGPSYSGPAPAPDPAMYYFAEGGDVPSDDQDNDSDDPVQQGAAVIKNLLKSYRQQVLGNSETGVIPSGQPDTNNNDQNIIAYLRGDGAAPQSTIDQYEQDTSSQDNSADDTSGGVIPTDAQTFADGGTVEADDSDDDDKEDTQQPAQSTASDQHVLGVAAAAQDDPATAAAIIQAHRQQYDHAASIVPAAVADNKPDVAAVAANKAYEHVLDGSNVSFAPKGDKFIANVDGAETSLAPDQMAALFNIGGVGQYDGLIENGSQKVIDAASKQSPESGQQATLPLAKPQPNGISLPGFPPPKPAAAPGSQDNPIQPGQPAQRRMTTVSIIRDGVPTYYSVPVSDGGDAPNYILPNTTEDQAVKAYGQHAVDVAKTIPNVAARQKFLLQNEEPDSRVTAANTTQQGRLKLEQFRQQQLADRQKALLSQRDSQGDAMLVRGYINTSVDKDPMGESAPAFVKAAAQRILARQQAATPQVQPTAPKYIPWTAPDGKTYRIQQ